MNFLSRQFKGIQIRKTFDNIPVPWQILCRHLIVECALLVDAVFDPLLDAADVEAREAALTRPNLKDAKYAKMQID